MGSSPWWYASIRASRYLKGAVAPWEWEDAPIFWREAALTAEAAEAKAQELQRERAEKKNRMKGASRPPGRRR